MTSRRVKKAVVCMAELIAALILIRGLLTFRTDVNGLDPPGGAVRLSGVEMSTVSSFILAV